MFYFYFFIFYFVDFTVLDLNETDAGSLFYFLFCSALKYNVNLLIFSKSATNPHQKIIRMEDIM